MSLFPQFDVNNNVSVRKIPTIDEMLDESEELEESRKDFLKGLSVADIQHCEIIGDTFLDDHLLGCRVCLTVKNEVIYFAALWLNESVGMFKYWDSNRAKNDIIEYIHEYCN